MNKLREFKRNMADLEAKIQSMKKSFRKLKSDLKKSDKQQEKDYKKFIKDITKDFIKVNENSTGKNYED